MANEARAKAAADNFRREHHLGIQPLGDLVALIEQTTGHDVAVLSAEENEHGLTLRDPVRGVVFIGVAQTAHPMRQRSTLAHELAHVLFEDWQDELANGGRSPQEIRADAFARHLLIPVEGLKGFLGGRQVHTLADLSQVVQWFLVSPPIAAIALCEAGYIDEVTKSEWMKVPTRNLSTQFGWADQYASMQQESSRTRAPQRLLARAVEGYVEGVVSAQAIASLRGMNVKDVKDELDSAGLEPRAPHSISVLSADLPEVSVDLSDLEDEEFKGPAA